MTSDDLAIRYFLQLAFMLAARRVVGLIERR
jgi:hypothetical protein